MTNLRTRRALAGAGYFLPAALSIFEFAGSVSSTIGCLVCPRLRRNRLDVFRERVHVDRPGFDARLAGLVHPAQRVLLPVRIVAILEVLARMRAAALLAILGAD